MCTKWRCLRIGVSFQSLPQCQAHLLIFPSPALPPQTSGLCGIRCRRSTVEELLPATASSTALWMMVSKAYFKCFCSWHPSSVYGGNLDCTRLFTICPLVHLRLCTDLMCASCVPTADNTFSVEVGGNETQFTLRELQPNQTYRLRIAAGTVVGFGVPSEWAQHQTLAHYNHSDHSVGKGDARCDSLSICVLLKSLYLLSACPVFKQAPAFLGG